MFVQQKKWAGAIRQWARVALFSLVAASIFLPMSLKGKETQVEDSLNASEKKQVMIRLSKLPMQFESNQGQTDPSVNYLSRGLGYSLFFTQKEIVMLFKSGSQEKESASSSVIKIQFIGANSDLVIKGVEEQENKNHYFTGQDPQNWHVNIPLYAKVVYHDLYPGIDAIFYGNQGQLEYDLILSPGSDPNNIRLHLDGTKELLIDQESNLCILSADGQTITMQKPFIYQEIEGKQVTIEGQFTLLASNEVGFHVEAYDTSKPLVIDPILSYSTYLGGTLLDIGYSIAVDSSGNAYVTGSASSIDFPTTVGAFQTVFAGLEDAFITKLNPAGSALIYSTYLGGTGSDEGYSIAIDSSGNAYVTGSTTSADFPTTASAFQTVLTGSSNAFITKLNPAGSALVYSTYLGSDGSNSGASITIDSSENAYVTGTTNSSTFPTTAGAYQETLAGLFDAFITKLNLDGSALVYSTYLGGTGFDGGTSIAIDESGNAYVTGYANSTDFPTTPGAFQTVFSGGFDDTFITKLNSTGTTLVYSTYLGGTGNDTGYSIAVDGSGNAYVIGTTNSSDFPTTPGAFQTFLAGNDNAFVSKLNPIGSALVYSTYLGGTGFAGGNSIAIDESGNAYLTGTTNSSDFPVTVGAFQSSLPGNFSAYLAKLTPTGSALLYSTYLGGSGDNIARGIALENSENVYITGHSNSINFPTTPGAFQPSLPGGSNAFITKFTFASPLFPPRNVSGIQKKNCFLTQTEYRNIISWQAPLEGNPPVLYRIYSDSNLTQLLATIPAQGPLIYIEHNLVKGKKYTYYIVSVDALDNSSLAATVTVN